MKYCCRISFVVLSVVVMLVTSCQKELSIEGAKIPITGLLVRSVAVSGSDSLVTIYTYDDEGRLETATTDGLSSGIQYHSFQEYERDEAGRIANTLFSEIYGGIVYDTIKTTVHYPDATGFEFDYSISTQNNFGFPVVDSAVYTYSAGNMTQVEVFTDYGLGYELSERKEFEFNAQGNVSVTNFYSSVSSPDGSLLHTTVFEYTYGTEPDYLWASASAAQNYWFTGLPNAENLNIRQLEVKDQTGIGSDLSILTSLEAGSNGKPETGVKTILPYNHVTTYTFYYR
ncbi:MAG: hypothetical protein KF746_20830 [Chitinophagaceae bacterium]|nr:hypothetical protein [Chitinophagaceae bacterium]